MVGLDAPLTEWERTNWAWTGREAEPPGYDVAFWRAICPKRLDAYETQTYKHFAFNKRGRLWWQDVVLSLLLQSGLNRERAHYNALAMRVGIYHKTRKLYKTWSPKMFRRNLAKLIQNTRDRGL